MNYIHITKENIDKEHICCAMSGKQSLVKKEWLRRALTRGLFLPQRGARQVLYRIHSRRKRMGTH